MQERETALLGLSEDHFLAQGTIQIDISESKKGIKTHHNVGSPLAEAKRSQGRIIEPFINFGKTDVRDLGRFLGIDEEHINRHPFPGPGLSVRILGEVTKERCDILREADAIYIDELKNRKSKPSCEGDADSGRSLYDEIWQAFAVLLPLRSTGISTETGEGGGNKRKYGYVLALRAITSNDAKTAAVYPFPMNDLLEISALITNKVREIGRVSYDISAKPPATIEWE